jgi:hypothetical protein
MSKLCFFNYSDGPYIQMSQTLIKSLRQNNVEYDFHVYGPSDVKGAINHRLVLTNAQKAQYMFKLHMLKEHVVNLEYDYYVFLDADNYCVSNPGNLLDCFGTSPVHSFLESDCTNLNAKRPDWWGCLLPDYVKMMRDKGVVSRAIYNVNAGFWGVKRTAVEQFYNLAVDFWNYTNSQGYRFTEEPPLAYATHMLAGDVEYHKQSKWFHIWASDWTGNFSNRIPNSDHWVFQDYMTEENHLVNPAIVHAMRSKNKLIDLATKDNLN